VLKILQEEHIQSCACDSPTICTHPLQWNNLIAFTVKTLLKLLQTHNYANNAINKVQKDFCFSQDAGFFFRHELKTREKNPGSNCVSCHWKKGQNGQI